MLILVAPFDKRGTTVPTVVKYFLELMLMYLYVKCEICNQTQAQALLITMGSYTVYFC